MFNNTNLSRESISTRLEPYKRNEEYIIKPVLKKQKTEYDENKNQNEKEKEKKQLNNVIVLADNKNYSREFLKCLGMTVGSPFLCTLHVPTKMFTFQIYGLEESDEKIFNHVKTNAGLIIITKYEEYNMLLKQIEFYCINISHIPILIVLENCSKTKTNTTDFIIKPNVKYELLEKNFNHSGYIQGGFGLENIGWFNSRVLKFKPLPVNLLELEELVKQFLDCELSIADWNHFNRLRLVYFSLKNFGYDKTIDQNGWLCVNWKKYKNTIGHDHLWNYTLTKFWIDQIFSLILSNPQMNLAQLYNEYNYLADGNLHKKYYTNELLFSDIARKEWIKPDKIHLN